MFRKIHSNRDPSVTLFGELRKEFAIYYNKGMEKFQSLLKAYPYHCYVVMLILIPLSCVYVFILTPQPRSAHPPRQTVKTQPVSDSFSGMMRAGSSLARTISLKKEIEAIVAKDSLTAKDGLRLESALAELEQIDQSLKQKP
ncbi:hypothetical protein [Pedobacter hiemivivus]|uniref:Uncharacterized protein n=1 Tax=Pedobacter hiemivivus TaxID=2530454 RepID=A0A4R0NF54_9SPHI|nr:hypothetical protein [Pedobacter hiemivivus]TCC98778.1 hypothetical protein EZ444_05750 [Pedobacter hiemivivus]